MKSTSAGGPVAAPRVQDFFDSPLAGRKFDRELEVCEIARRVLSFCRYRRAPGHFTFSRPAPRPDVLGLRRRRSSFLVLDLAHPLRWHGQAHRRGLSGASGCFVFEVLEGLSDGALVVLAARQGRGCSLRHAYAPARPKRNSWRLEWRGLPAEYSVVPATPPAADDDYYRWPCGAV